MIPAATLDRARAIWTANPALSAAVVQRRLGAKVSTSTLQKLRPQPHIPCGEVNLEPTRAILRARAAELGFVAFDGPSLPHGSVIAIARASRKRGYIVSSESLRYAWEYGVRELEEWPLCEPFLNGVKL